MEKYTILIILFGIIICLVLVVLYLVNNILLKKQKVDFQFTTIVNTLQERTLLLERIYEFIKNNTENEKKYLKEINESKDELNKIKNSTKENIKLIKQSNQVLEKFTKLKEIYKQLSKNKIYTSLVNEIDLNSQRVNYAFETYDKEVTRYNQQKHTKINSIISNIFCLKDYEHYNE